MYRRVILLATVVICGWAGLGWAAHGGPSPDTVDPAYEAPHPAGDCCGCGCHDCVSGCGSRNGCASAGCRHRLAQKWADVGYFNCQCRGSYKFPVPPQYTYHWPGMYSQQTMTEYSSPYRFPALRSPEKVFDRQADEPDTNETAGPPAGPTRATLSAEPNKLPNLDRSSIPPQRPATTSQKMKHLYGVP